jgi:hypothetical protein
MVLPNLKGDYLPKKKITQPELPVHNSKKNTIVFDPIPMAGQKQGATVDGQYMTGEEYASYLNRQGGGGGAKGLASFEALKAGMTPKVENQLIKDRMTPEQIQLQQEQQALSGLQAPSADTLAPDQKPAGIDALDIGKIVGGATGGAATGAAIGAGLGSVVPGLGTAVGAGIGGGLGLIGGAAATFFYSASGDRTQQVKVTNKNAKEADVNINKLFNDANSGKFSKQYLKEYYDYEWSRMEQAERELHAQQSALFGEKLSKSQDELIFVRGVLAQKARRDLEFELALAQPDPSKIVYVQDYNESLDPSMLD